MPMIVPAPNYLIGFGNFSVDRARRRLLRDDEEVPLNSKAFELLLVLLERKGDVVSKNELLDAVWPGQFVEENNLTVQIAALRKALGESKGNHNFIITIPGRGYQFIADTDDPSEGDVVIESREISRIVLEETVDVRNLRTDAGFNDRPASPAKPNSHVRFAVGLLIATAVLGALAGGYAIRDRLETRAVPSRPFNGHSVRQLTTNGKVGLAALSPDGKLFTYTIDDLGQKSLWLGYVDGGNHIELRPPAEATYRSITFSPDGKDLYFSIRDEKNPKPALYRMPAFGGVGTKLLDEVGSFSLSPDGRSIAIARRDDVLGMDILAIASLDGKLSRDVASFPKDLSFRFDTISWSADGKRLAVSAKKQGEIEANEVAILDIGTGDVTRVRHENLREITKTAWLADGSGVIVTAIKPDSHSSVPQYVVYLIGYPDGVLHPITFDTSNYGASWHNDAGVTLSLSAGSDLLLAVEHRQLSNVWVAPADDLGTAKQITFSSFGKYDGLWGMDWTPEGKLIYTTSDTKSQFLSQMERDGSAQKQITAPAGFDSVVTVAQDGRYIVFHSDRNSTIDIWRTDIDGSNPTQLTFGGKGFHPAPSSDGKWVYYRSTLNGHGQLCRVPIEGGEPEILNDADTGWISFSPDGKYFSAWHLTDKPRLAVFSAETNQILKQFDLPKTGTLYMGSRWTPDSQAVAYRDTSFGYWIQPIDGGEPHRLQGLPTEKLYNFSWSKDGKWLAFVRGQEIRDVVLLQNQTGK